MIWQGPAPKEGQEIAAGGQRVGISTDPVGKQARFADKERFDYPLLSDADGAVATAFGVKRGLLGKFMPVKRTTFVIDTDRRVLDVIASELSMDTHADRALEVLRSRSAAYFHGRGEIIALLERKAPASVSMLEGHHQEALVVVNLVPGTTMSSNRFAQDHGDAQAFGYDLWRSRQIADTSESLLKAERAAQEKLAQQLRQLEADKQALQADLGFFERLLPSSGEGLQVRGLQAEVLAPGQLRYQMLVVQNGKVTTDFRGRYERSLTGTLDGKPFNQSLPGGAKPLQLRLYTRVEGMLDHPPDAVIKTVQVRVIDSQGAVRTTQSVKLAP